MFKSLYLAVLVLVCAIAGCGGGSPKELPITKAAHGGTLVTLPREQGFAEILVETTAGKRGTAKAAVKARILAYFIQPDGSTAMSSGPTDVKVKIGMGEDGRVADLTPDSQEPGLFASASGDYPDEFSGQLRASLNGNAIEVPVRVR